MPSLSDNFDQLWQRLRHGRGFSHTGDDPVYTSSSIHPRCWRSKRRLRQWAAVLKKQDWTMETFSMAEAIKDISKRMIPRSLARERRVNVLTQKPFGKSINARSGISG